MKHNICWAKYTYMRVEKVERMCIGNVLKLWYLHNEMLYTSTDSSDAALNTNDGGKQMNKFLDILATDS